MSEWIDRALTTPTAAAGTAVADAAVQAAGAAADRLLGGRPVPGTPDWETADPDREIAWQLLTLRLLLAGTVDVLPTVAGLRRWGVTWELIAKAAGSSRQAAHERWSTPVRTLLDPYGTGELGGPVADDDHP
jgi:hypothetical protein